MAADRRHPSRILWRRDATRRGWRAAGNAGSSRSLEAPTRCPEEEPSRQAREAKLSLLRLLEPPGLSLTDHRTELRATLPEGQPLPHLGHGVGSGDDGWGAPGRAGGAVEVVADRGDPADGFREVVGGQREREPDEPLEGAVQAEAWTRGQAHADVFGGS